MIILLLFPKKQDVSKETVAKVVKVVSDEFEKKKKKKKSNNNDEIVEVVEKKITKKRKMIIQSSDEDNVPQEAENQQEIQAYVRRKEIAKGKAKIVVEPKSKKQKKTEDVAKALLRGSKGICFSEPDSVPVVRSEVAPIEVVPTPEPEKATSESPVFVHVLTPPSSPITIPSSHANKPNSPPPSPIPDASIPSSSPSTNLVSDQAADDHVLNIPPIQTLFPPHTNISISQPPPHANYESFPSTTLNNHSDSILPTSASHEQLLRDCNYSSKPRLEAEVVVLDSDTEVESSYRLNREPQPYFFPTPAFSKTQLKSQPTYPIGE